MNTLIILQARTNSRRLPGKSLLSIKGIPLGVLCAKRAANTGIKLVIATSKKESDDLLVYAAKEHNISVIRGSLNNVLKRFYLTSKLNPEYETIVRLTGDNPAPDGTFIQELLNEFEERNLQYLRTDIKNGLPFGVSVEIFTKNALHEAYKNASNLYQEEHVTPYIREKFGDSISEKISEKFGHFRVTIDTFQDFLAFNDIIKNMSQKEMIDIPLSKYIKIMKKSSLQPKYKKPATNFIMGTVQLGLAYGITREKRKEGEETEMLELAVREGVIGFDTAQAYGNSEECIGKNLAYAKERVNIYTKLDPFTQLNEQAPTDLIKAKVDLSISESKRKLELKQIHTLMLHRAEHLHSHNSEIWNHAKQHQEIGNVRYLGVSIQSPEELKLALSFDEISHIQLPYNILDHRWEQVKTELNNAKNQRKITIHARSLMLQGLLLSSKPHDWKKAHSTKEVYNTLLEIAKNVNLELQNMLLSYAQSQDWIDGLVIGSDTLKQLKQNIRLTQNRILTNDELAYIKATIPKVEQKTLNPALWNKK